MSDDNTPTQPEGAEGDFTFEIDKHGNLLVDGVVMERTINPLRMQSQEQESGDEEPVEEPPSEPPTPSEPAKDDTVRDTPGKQKFKLKVYGEELEKEFDQNELIVTLQKGLASEKRFQEVAAKEREIEPFQHIVKSDKFKQWLDEQIQAGEIEKPAPPPKPEPEDIMGYRLRQRQANFGAIREAMGEYAITLPQYEAQLLESNHRVFNQVFDRFEAASRQNESANPQNKVVATKEVAEAILATKEIRKDSARSERSGLHPAEFDSEKATKQRVAILQRKSRAGDLNASIELARILFGNEMG